MGFNKIIAGLVPLLGLIAFIPAGAWGTPLKIGMPTLSLEFLGHLSIQIHFHWILIFPWLQSLIAWKFSPAGNWASPKTISFWLSPLAPAFLLWGTFQFFIFWDYSSSAVVAPLLSLFVWLVGKLKSQFYQSILDLGKLFTLILLLLLFLISSRILPEGYYTWIGIHNFSHRWSWRQSGLMWFGVIFVFQIYQKQKGIVALKQTARWAKQSLVQIQSAWFSILALCIFSQLLQRSGINNSGMASLLDSIPRPLNPFWQSVLAPWYAAAGSLILGSATISNLTLGHYYQFLQAPFYRKLNI